jgi:hypothetical protein
MPLQTSPYLTRLHSKFSPTGQVAEVKIALLPPANIGPIGTAEVILEDCAARRSACRDSVWTVERLLRPVKLQTPYGGLPDGLPS